MALVQDCVWGHVQAYVRVVQGALGALVLVLGIVTPVALMHVLPGVRNRQQAVVVARVAVCVTLAVTKAVVVVRGAVQAVEKVVELHVPGLVRAVPEAVT